MPRKTTLGGVRPHTRNVAEEILARWVIFYVWGDGPDGHHAAGRAIDFMVLTEDQRAIRTRVGNEIAAYVRRHHKRLGVQYVIWRRRIWNATRSDDRNRVAWSSWRLMADRGNPTANHMDHPHVSLRNNPSPYRPPNEEDDMPSAKEIVDELLSRDAVEVPWPSKNKKRTVKHSLEYILDNAWKGHVHSREMHAQITGLSAAVKALAESKGLDGKEMADIVGKAVHGELASFEARLADAEVVLRTSEENP